MFCRDLNLQYDTHEATIHIETMIMSERVPPPKPNIDVQPTGLSSSDPYRVPQAGVGSEESASLPMNERLDGPYATTAPKDLSTLGGESHIWPVQASYSPTNAQLIGSWNEGINSLDDVFLTTPYGMGHS